MNIVGHRNVFYAISGFLVLASLTAIAAFGLPLGIDFTGGSLLEVEFRDARPEVGELSSRLTALNLGEIRFQPTGERGVIIRARHVDESTHQEILRRLSNPQPGTRDPETISEKRFDTIGPVIGRELARKSAMAIILVLLLIVAYIAWAFRAVSLPVARKGEPRTLASWKYGLVTVVALLHDILIPAGFFALAGRLAGFEVDALFVTALLTILGFSVHDTIVVFDRIRENLKRRASTAEFGTVVNQSVGQTFTRSVNTSVTVLLALTVISIYGGTTTRAFSLTLLTGILAGTYSSIFIASPLLVTWHNFHIKRRSA